MGKGEKTLKNPSSWGIAWFIGLGFYWAWLMLAFYSTILSPPSQAAVPLVQNIWTWSAWAHALTLISLALVVKPIKKYFMQRWDSFAVCKYPKLPSEGACPCYQLIIVAAAILTSVATLLIPAGYLFAETAPLATSLMSTTGAVLTGIGTAVIVLFWGGAYARMGATFSTFGIIGAYLASAVIYYLVLLLPSHVAMVFEALLPLLCGLCFLPAWKYAKIQPEHEAYPLSSRVFSPRLLIPLVAIFLYSFFGEILRGFSTISSENAALLSMGKLYVFGCALGSIVLGILLIALPAIRRKSLSEMAGIRPALIIMAAGFLVTTIFNTSFFVAYAIFGAAFQCIRIFVWTYSAYISEKTGLSPLSVFGISQGTCALAVVIGTPLIQTLTSAIQLGATQWSAIALVVVFLIFVSTIFVLNSKDLSTVWGLVIAQAQTAERQLEDSQSALLGAAEANQAERINALTEEFSLTPREQDVARLLIKGRSLPFICRELYIAKGTAQTHIDHIYKKLGVHNRQQFLDLVEQTKIKP